MPDYKELSDEELVELIQKTNDEMAASAITERYFRLRFAYMSKVGNGLQHAIGDWEANYVYFATYENCLQKFVRSKGRRFKTYFLTALEHAFVHAARKARLFDPIRVLSYDTDMPSKSGTLTFSDSLATTNLSDNPVAFFDYKEAFENLRLINEKTDKLTLQVVGLKMKGLTYRQVAKVVELSAKQVRSRYENYMKEIHKKLHI